MSERKTVLQLTGVCKRFKGVFAVNHVDLTLQAGEIHALLGENGAGKSTLIKVMTGVYAADSGRIELGGAPVNPQSPLDAQRHGISTVYQEVNLLPNLSVAHNVYLGREPRRFGCIQWGQLRRNAEALLQQFDVNIDVSESLSCYSIAIQQLIAIARAVDCSAKVLILDEPTASLDAKEVAVLFRILRGLRDQGVAILFVTHFLDQVYDLTDRITVLRNGEKVGTFDTAALPREQLVAHMLGKELQALEAAKNSHQSGDGDNTTLQVQGLATTQGLRGISFSAQPGDAVGLAGLLGAGRSELCAALFGLAPATDGTIQLHGRPYRPKSPADAVAHGIALCPEDRKIEGIVHPLSVRENMILALQAKRGWWRPLPRREQNQLAADATARLRIVCSDPEKPIGELSGGNQQKVILARWLMTHPQVLVLDEPTRGIDIGAHAEILQLIRQLCAEGMTLIVASSEIEELVAFSNKILVLRDKQLRTVIDSHAISENAVLAAIAGSN
jgi:simple sugar transport system ATP-binding protein